MWCGVVCTSNNSPIVLILKPFYLLHMWYSKHDILTKHKLILLSSVFPFQLHVLRGQNDDLITPTLLDLSCILAMNSNTSLLVHTNINLVYDWNKNTLSKLETPTIFKVLSVRVRLSRQRLWIEENGINVWHATAQHWQFNGRWRQNRILRVSVWWMGVNQNYINGHMSNCYVWDK